MKKLSISLTQATRNMLNTRSTYQILQSLSHNKENVWWEERDNKGFNGGSVIIDDITHLKFDVNS